LVLQLDFSNEDDDEEERGKKSIDPNVAITFVVAAPNRKNGAESELEFVHFHNFVNDLEQLLFEEADDIVNDSREEIPIGDLVTIAPFHPDWTFAGGFEKNNSFQNPLDYEKRTPHPMVSLVRTSAIDAAGEESTRKILKHNEKVLMGLGSHILSEMFREKVYVGEDG